VSATRDGDGVGRSGGPADEGRRASYREGVGFGALSFASVMMITLVSSVVIARIYGIDVVGEYALATAPATALFYLSTVREQAALVRELSTLSPRAPRVTGLFVSVMTFSFAITVAAAAIVGVATYYLLAGPIGHPELFAPALAGIVGYVILANTVWNLDMVFGAFRAGRELYWFRLAQAIAFVAIAIPVGMRWSTVWGLTLAGLGAWFVALVHRLAVVGRYMRPRVPPAEIRKGFRTLPAMVRFGLRVAPGEIAHGVSDQAGVWVLGIMVPIPALGAYSRAQTLASRLEVASSRVVEMLLPTLVRRRARGDEEGFDRSVIDTTRYMLIIMLFIAGVGGGAAESVMKIFGPGFSQGSAALAVLLLLPAATAVIAVQNTVLLAGNRPLLTTIVASGRAVATVALTVVLARAYGITGAAIALVGGEALSAVAFAPFVSRQMARPVRALWPYRRMAALVAAYVVSLTLGRAVDVLVPGVLGLLASLAIGVVAFITILSALAGLEARDRERLARLRAGIEARLATPRALRARAVVRRAVLIGVPAVVVAVPVPAVATGLIGDRSIELALGLLVIGGVAFLAWQTDPAWTLSAGLVCSVFSTHWDDLGIPLSVDRLLVVGGALAVLLRAPSARERPPLRLGPEHLLLVLAILWTIGSAIAAGTLADSLGISQLLDRIGIVPLLVVLAAPFAFRTARQRSVLLAHLVGLGAYLGIVALLETINLKYLIYPRYIADPDIGQHFDRARGPFLTAVVNGMALFVCAAAALLAFALWQRAGPRAIALVVAALCSAGELFTLTRSVWIGAGIAAIVTLVAFREIRRFLVPALGVGAVAVFGLLVVIPGLQGKAQQRSENQQTVWVRENLAAGAVRMIEERPLVGFGWRTFETASPPFLRQAPNRPLIGSGSPVHNTFLSNAAELGLVGAGLWTAALLWAVLGAVLGRGPPSLLGWRMLTLAVAVEFVVVANFVLLVHPFPYLVVWTFVGIATAWRAAEPATAPARSSASRLPPVPAPAAPL
jgi:O-antigen/teichoic acid export membrane protein/O-antigen ligase